MNPGQSGRLFGFSYKQDELEEIQKVSPVPPNRDDGVTVAAGGLTGYSVPMDSGAQKDYDMIRNYRCMALHPEVDSAIEDIINEAIVSDTNDVPQPQTANRNPLLLPALSRTDRLCRTFHGIDRHHRGEGT